MKGLRRIVDDVSSLPVLAAPRRSTGLGHELRLVRTGLIVGSEVRLVGFHTDLVAGEGVSRISEAEWERALALADRAVELRDWGPFTELHLAEFRMIASGVPADDAGSWHEEMSFLGEGEFDDDEELRWLVRTRDRLVAMRAACPTPGEFESYALDLAEAIDAGVLQVADWGFMPGAAGFELDSSYLEGVTAAGLGVPFGLVDVAGSQLLGNSSRVPTEIGDRAQGLGAEFVQRRLMLDELPMNEILRWREVLYRELARFRLRLLELANNAPAPGSDPQASERWLAQSLRTLDIELARLILSIEDSRRGRRVKSITEIGTGAAGFAVGAGSIGVVRTVASILQTFTYDPNSQSPLYFVYRLSAGR